MASHETIPGPGNYFIGSNMDGPRYSIRKKLPGIKKNITPVTIIQGPGDYNTATDLLYENKPKWKIPSSSRDQLTSIEKLKASIPGPGSYNLLKSVF